MQKVIRTKELFDRMSGNEEIKDKGITTEDIKVVYEVFVKEVIESLQKDERVVLERFLSLYRKPIKRKVFTRKPKSQEKIANEMEERCFLALRTNVLTHLADNVVHEISLEEYRKRTDQSK